MIRVDDCFEGLLIHWVIYGHLGIKMRKNLVFFFLKNIQLFGNSFMRFSWKSSKFHWRLLSIIFLFLPRWWQQLDRDNKPHNVSEIRGTHIVKSLSLSHLLALFLFRFPNSVDFSFWFDCSFSFVLSHSLFLFRSLSVSLSISISLRLSCSLVSLVSLVMSILPIKIHFLIVQKIKWYENYAVINAYQLQNISKKKRKKKKFHSKR